MELRREVAQREVQLGCEQEHREAGFQPEPSFHQTDADSHRDQAIPRVAASSRTAPERKAMRSVAIVARRYESLTARDLHRLAATSD